MVAPRHLPFIRGLQDFWSTTQMCSFAPRFALAGVESELIVPAPALPCLELGSHCDPRTITVSPRHDRPSGPGIPAGVISSTRRWAGIAPRPSGRDWPQGWPKNDAASLFRTAGLGNTLVKRNHYVLVIFGGGPRTRRRRGDPHTASLDASC